MRYVTYKTPVRTGVEFFMIFSLFGFIAGGFTGATSGCKTLTPEAKQHILSAEKVACGLANAFMSDPEITAICNFADQETGPILNLVSQHRVALAKSRAVGVTEGASHAGACAPTPALVPPKAGSGGASTSSADAGLPAQGVKDAGISRQIDAGKDAK